MVAFIAQSNKIWKALTLLELASFPVSKWRRKVPEMEFGRTSPSWTKESGYVRHSGDARSVATYGQCMPVSRVLGIGPECGSDWTRFAFLGEDV